MYDEFAHLWQQISAPEEYEAEAAELREVIFDLLKSPAGKFTPSLLEFGSGGGNALSHLTPFFNCVATDPATDMLEISQQVNLEAEHIAGDMRALRLDRKFDVVVVLDAVSYILTEDDLRSTFRTARAHLDPGGVFIAGPDWIEGVTPVPNISCKLGKPGELSYSEFVHDPDTADNSLEVIFTFYLPQPDGTVKVEEDRHQHGIFPLQTWLLAMRDAGFEAGTHRYPPDVSGGSGYYITGIAI